MDLNVDLGSLHLKNPLIAASGCFGYGVEYAEVVNLKTLGGIAVKGLFLSEREGHNPPRIVETPAGHRCSSLRLREATRLIQSRRHSHRQHLW